MFIPHKITLFHRLLIGLQSNGQLVYICSETLISTEINPGNHYVNFIAFPQYENGYHILAVTELNEVGSSQIQLIDCSSFDVVFSLNLTHNIFLIAPETVNDEHMYITEISHDQKIRELRFTLIYETSPERRLEKLLKKGCFEEAETFAASFNLDVNVIRKARAQTIVDERLCDQADIDMLLELLDKIGDVKFTLQCCLDVHLCCEEAEDVRRVLEYGCRELPNYLVSFLLVFVE